MSRSCPYAALLEGLDRRGALHVRVYIYSQPCKLHHAPQSCC
jgi:hypothetical protein